MRTIRHLSTLILVFILILSVSSPAKAHRLNVFVLPEGDRLTGEAYFNDGAPAKNCPVKMIGLDGTVLVEDRTDGGGGFSLPLPDTTTPITVVVEGGMGHRGETTLQLFRKAAPTAEVTPSIADEGLSAQKVSHKEIESLVNQAVKREVAPLREEILRLNRQLSRPDMTEIVGGLGYIVGLVGVALAVGSRKKHG